MSFISAIFLKPNLDAGSNISNVTNLNMQVNVNLTPYIPTTMSEISIRTTMLAQTCIFIITLERISNVVTTAAQRTTYVING